VQPAGNEAVPAYKAAAATDPPLPSVVVSAAFPDNKLAHCGVETILLTDETPNKPYELAHPVHVKKFPTIAVVDPEAVLVVARNVQALQLAIPIQVIEFHVVEAEHDQQAPAPVPVPMTYPAVVLHVVHVVFPPAVAIVQAVHPSEPVVVEAQETQAVPERT